MLLTNSVDEGDLPGYPYQWRGASAWTVTRPDQPWSTRSTSVYSEGSLSPRGLISPVSDSASVCDPGALALTAPRSCHGKGAKRSPGVYGLVLRTVPDSSWTPRGLLAGMVVV